ncbi:MAG: hypothetical protein ACTTIT_07640, partial [Treponema sp.]
MAWFIPADWVGGALGFARLSHLLASHWYYIFMAFHIGLHTAMIASKMKIHGIVPRIICILMSLYGIYACIIRGVWKYMFGLQQFFFFDFERGYVLFAVDYISILVLFATISHYVEKMISTPLTVRSLRLTQKKAKARWRQRSRSFLQSMTNLSRILFFIALLCIFYISNRKTKFDKNKWDKVSHRFEM